MSFKEVNSLHFLVATFARYNIFQMSGTLAEYQITERLPKLGESAMEEEPFLQSISQQPQYPSDPLNAF